MERFASSFAVIAGGIALGLAFKALVSGRLGSAGPALLARLRRALQRASLLGLNPLAFAIALWALPFEASGLALPVAGLAAMALGLGIGVAFRPLFRAEPPARAICAEIGPSFYNIGNIGGLAVYLILGPGPFAWIPFYKLGEELWYYGVLFPRARRLAIAAGLVKAEGRARGPLRMILSNPLLWAMIAAMGAGLGLNASGVARPEALGRANDLIVPLSSFLLLVSIGTQLRFSMDGSAAVRLGALVAARLALAPLAVAGLLALMGAIFDPGAYGLIPLAAILSAMPAAFLSMVAADMNGLDPGFMGSYWLLSMASLALSLPLAALLFIT
jgi:hypothetical protein